MLILEEKSEAIASRWARSAALGIRADAHAYPEGTTDHDLKDRRERLDEVLREEASVRLNAPGLVAIVADREGVILASHGDIESPAAKIRLVSGARWGEEVRGTNAIGTAIIERQAVGVIGAAHFEERNHGIFCYGHPVFDAFGELIAVLDVTGPLALHDPRFADSVRHGALAIERVLRGLAYERSGAGNLAAIERLVARSSSATLLVEASGRVALMNDRSRPIVREETRCEKIFGVTFSELASMPRDLTFETTEGKYRVEIEPIRGGGRPLAAVMFLEPISTKSPPAAKPHSAFASILGSDAALVRAKESATKFAATDLPVLLLAETGTGKELFARAIHASSTRASGAFIALNCGALASSVLESELFGHAPSAFTGASKTGADGKIGAANGGTLFLDEIAEMPDALQAMLLRVLDEGVYFRVGDAKSRKSDFRLVCATCRDLPALVESGAFRRDLFYRIHGACIQLPTLRARTDRQELAAGLTTNRLSEDAKAWIQDHDWPGNVRELKSALLHATALAGDGLITREHFPRVLVNLSPEPRTRVEILNEAIKAAVKASAGNVSEAARRLGVARSTVYRVLKG